MDSPARITVNIPSALVDVFRRRLAELGYDKAPAYFISLMVYDLYVRKPHLLTGSLKDDAPEIRDKFFAEIARDFDSYDRPPAWFEARMREAAEKLAGTALERLREETYRLQATIREQKGQIHDLKEELAYLRAQHS